MTTKREIDLELHSAVGNNLGIDVDVAPPPAKKINLVDKKANTEERGEIDISNMRALVNLEGGSGLDITIENEIKGGMVEDESEAIVKKIIEETVVDVEFIINIVSTDSNDSIQVSSGGDHPGLEDTVVDAELSLPDHDRDDGGYLPLSGYPLVDRFPDLDHDLEDPECGCCHCDMSDKKGTMTSEPDLVLYSDRTSDTIMSDCRYFVNRQGRDTGYNFWDVED